MRSAGGIRPSHLLLLLLLGWGVAEAEDEKATMADRLLARAAAESQADQALASIERALALYEELGDSAGVAAALHALAAVHERQGKLAEALQLEQRALAIHDRRGEVGEARLAVLRGIGNIQRRLGHLAASLAILAQARQEARKLGSVRTDAEIGLALGETLAARDETQAARVELTQAWQAFRTLQLPDGIVRARLALAALADTAPGEAVVHARAALALLDRIPAREGMLPPPAASVGTAGLHARACRLGVDAALEVEDLDAALFFAERGSAASLLASLDGRHAAGATIAPAGLRRVIDTTRRALRDAEFDLASAVEAGVRRRIQVSRRALQAAQDAHIAAQVRLEEARRQAVDPASPAPASLSAVREALPEDVALVHFAGLESRAPHALVITTGIVRAVRLDAVEAWPVPHLSAEPWDAAAGERLRAGLAEPLGLAETVRRLIVVPDGPLALLPPVVLWPEHAVSYVPSASVWLRLRETRHEEGAGVLAIADSRPESSLLPGRLCPLPGTRAEARAVGDELLLGDEATPARLRKLLARPERWRAIHFAGHARIDRERPLLSALMLTATAEESGRLTVLDVMSLDVSADLVVLSASESACGKVYPGEGVLGFPRAFLQAGASRVVGALWCPDDAATTALMIRFHERWRGEPALGAAAALRRAQMHVRAQERWEHPRFWAGWVLWGLGS